MSKLRWHLGHLDSLRGIAVLGVVLVHSASDPDRFLQLTQKVGEVAFLGQRGVQLFFIVSAFTLFLSAQNRREEVAPSRNFFIRRFFRLAPMFYLATLGGYFVWPRDTGSPTEILRALTFVHGLSPATITRGARGGWSVADEALFYFLFPLLFRWIRTLKQAGLWWMICVSCSYLLLHVLVRIDPANEEFYTFFSFIAEFPVFLCGIVAFFIWREYLQKQQTQGSHPEEAHRRPTFRVLIFGLLAVLYVILPSTSAKIVGTSVILAAFLLLLCFYQSTVLVNVVTRFLGKISYSVYLIHFFFMDLLWRVQPEHFTSFGRFAPYALLAVHFFGTLLLTVPLAFLTWRYIEEPGIRLGRQLIDVLEGRASTSDPPLIPPMAAASQAGNSPDAQF